MIRYFINKDVDYIINKYRTCSDLIPDCFELYVYNDIKHIIFTPIDSDKIKKDEIIKIIKQGFYVLLDYIERLCKKFKQDETFYRKIVNHIQKIASNEYLIELNKESWLGDEIKYEIVKLFNTFKKNENFQLIFPIYDEWEPLKYIEDSIAPRIMLSMKDIFEKAERLREY